MTDKSRRDRHRLSDGRDVRQIAEEIEGVAIGRKTSYTGIPPVDAMILLVDSQAVHGKLATLMKHANEDDLEKLLRVSNERGWSESRLPGTPPTPLEAEQLFLRNYLEYGPGVGMAGAFNGFRMFYRALEATPQDTRDADTIAEEFLRRVQALANFRGEDELSTHLEAARTDVLGDLSERMRGRVLEKILDLEEACASSAAESASLRDERAARTKAGWRALVGEPGKKLPANRGR